MIETSTAAEPDFSRPKPRITANPIPYWSRDNHVASPSPCSSRHPATSPTPGSPGVKADVPDGMTNHELSASKRLWAEPGRGVVDFDAVVAAMPRNSEGDYMIEVNEPSVDSRYESHSIAYAWAREALSFAYL